MHWPPTTSGVYFLYDDQGDTRSVSTRRQLQKNATTPLASNSASGGGSFSVSRTGTIAFTLGRPDNPGDVAVSTSGAMRVLTAINQELLQQKCPAASKRFGTNPRKISARFRAGLVQPPNFDPAKNIRSFLKFMADLLLITAIVLISKSKSGQHSATSCFYTNPRGSTSYGEEFANLIHHAYPGDDSTILTAASDAIVAKGYIDATISS